MGTLGRVIHSTLQNNAKSNARMEFGSPAKYSGFMEKHWDAAFDNQEEKDRSRLFNSVGSVKRRSNTGRFDLQSKSMNISSAVSNSKKDRSDLPTTVDRILAKQHAMDKVNPLEDGDMKGESLLSDSYLPILRSFATT